MKRRNAEVLKGLIRLAESVDKADALLQEEFPTMEERFAFLRGAFTFTIVAGEDDTLEGDYWAVLSTIVNQEWRA